MTRRARALAIEDRLASRGVPGGCDTSSRLGERPQIRDDLDGLCLRDVVRRHRRVRDAVANDADEFLIRQRPAELATPEVDTRDLIAVGAMAVRAGVPERATAVFDIESCGVLGGQGTARGKKAGGDEHENRGGGLHKS